MRTLLTGACTPANIYHLVDPTEFAEIDFEAEVVKAFNCLLPQYFCGVFAGEFVLEGERKSADLALIHKSLSHWFVIEVELASHSLEYHVIPQVRCFRYGEPDPSCITSLCRGFPGMGRQEAKTIIANVPRFVAVVSNVYDVSWVTPLRLIDVQYLSVAIFSGSDGRTAHEVQGQLSVARESLGFGRFLGVDNSFRLPKSCGLRAGVLEMEDPAGIRARWVVREEEGNLWFTKERGVALIPNGAYVQIVRTIDGRICFRISDG